MAPPRDRRPGFSRRAQYSLFIGYVAAAAGALVGAGLLLLSAINPQAFASLRAGVREVTTPVSTGLHWLRDGVASIPRAVGDYFHVVDENRRLRAQVTSDRKLIERARNLVQENRRLSRLLRIRDRTPETVAVARLVSSSATSTRRFATLNAGTRQGVRPGQPVLGPTGLIGRVTETGPNTAQVLLIIDPESIVPVKRTRDNLAAIVVGRGDGLVDVRSISTANAPLLAGDNFVTTGTGGIFPPGVPVARIMRSARDIAPGRTFAAPDALDYALVQRAYFPEATVARPQAAAP